MTVKGEGFEDSWVWTPAAEKEKPATFKCTGSTKAEAGLEDWAEIPYEGMGRPKKQ